MRNSKDKGAAVLQSRIRGVAAALLLTSMAAAPVMAREAASITFNLKEAELETVAATVAEFTGRNFIIDPRVKGKVTVISAKPMTPDEVYQTFLSLLEVHNFAAVRIGNVTKIIPSVNAKQLGGAGSGDGSRLNDEVVTQVIEVKNISASQLVPILRPLVPQEGHMAAYAPTNVLIVSDRAANLQRLLKLIERIDVASASEIEVYPLHHASATEVVRILESLRQREKQADPQASVAVVLVADERTNSILISGDKAERLSIRALITHLDTPLESTGNTHVVYLRYAKAKDLVAVLTGVSESIEKEQQGGGKAPAAPVGGRSPVTIQAHEDTNSLVITAPPDLMKSLQGVISQLDIRRAQVQVEAIIAEVNDDKSAELGVSWFADGTPDNKGPVAGTAFNSFNAAAAHTLLKDGTIPAIPTPLSFLGFGRFNTDKTDFTALLTAIQGDGRGNVLSRPTVITLDNEEAEIIVGQNVPFRTGQYSNTGNSSLPTNPFTTIKRENVGITLKVKPQINEGDAVKLDIEQKVDSVVKSPEGAADLTTNTRSIKTSVLVDDGGTIVLGGLIKDDVQESVRKVPLLGDIPFIGALFRSTSTTKVKSNLMVFLKPTIIRDQAVLARVTSGKYDYMRAEQLGFQKKGVSFVKRDEIPVLPEFMELPPSYEEIKKLPALPQPSLPPPPEAMAPAPAPETAAVESAPIPPEPDPATGNGNGSQQ